MGRRLIGSGVLGLALMALGPATSQAALLDANCPGPTSSGQNASAEAQNFTAMHTGTLVRGEMFVAKTAGADFQMYIMNTGPSGPTGDPLGTANIPDSSVANIPSPGPTSPSAPVDGTFSPGVNVTAGQQYAIVVTRGGSSFTAKDAHADPPCPGDEFLKNSLSSPWSLQPQAYDLPFSTYLATPNEPTSKPSNAFTIGKVKGTKLTLSLPGPGGVDIANGGGGSKAKKFVKSSHTDVAAGGDVVVPIALTKRGKSLLRKKGKLKAPLGITFTPTGGDPSSQNAKLKLKGKHK